jgi:hypothetical protein
MDEKKRKPDEAPLPIPPIAAVDENGEPEWEPSGWNRRSWYLSQYLYPSEKE